MDSNASALMGMILPKVPMLMKTAALHSLSMSETSSKWDLKTELMVSVLRSEMSKPKASSITEQQRNANKVPEVKGQMWVANYTAPAPPEDDVRQKLLKAINDMKAGGEQYTVPDLAPVEAEWHGFRAGASKTEPEPKHLTDAQKYENLMKEVQADSGTALYFHGGAYYLMDAGSQRPMTVRYARYLGGGRTYAVRYRLCPQHAFPAALLDALVSYLTLLHPPPGALHAAIPAPKIVVAGDSAGGNLALVFMQTLLQWHRSAGGTSAPKVRWHGQDVEVPLPGGMALSSPWADVTRSLPSITANSKFDYLPLPSLYNTPDRHPPCAAWPAKPPRATLLCEGSAMAHPLLSPIAAPDWKGCPPTLWLVGEEMMSDEARVLAQRMARQGVPTRWAQFEAMPHCFALLFEDLPATRLAFERWREWAGRVVGGGGAAVETKGEWVAAKSLASKKVDVEKLTGLGDDEVLETMRKAQTKVCEEWEKSNKVEEPRGV